MICYRLEKAHIMHPYFISSCTASVTQSKYSVKCKHSDLEEDNQPFQSIGRLAVSFTLHRHTVKHRVVFKLRQHLRSRLWSVSVCRLRPAGLHVLLLSRKNYATDCCLSLSSKWQILW